MLTEEQLDEFEEKGLLILPQFLSDRSVKSLVEAVDTLHGDHPFNDKARWDMRNCLSRHSAFADVVEDESLLGKAVQLLSFNIKLLGSHVVKMRAESKTEDLALDWHRDGGVLSAELPDPLPPLFIKAAFCLSGSTKQNGGELLVVPGSQRLLGELAFDLKSNQPFGVTRAIMKPGDMMIFDWRLWHAVSPNWSQVTRRTLYVTFGFRWLAPMDYVKMPVLV